MDFPGADLVLVHGLFATDKPAHRQAARSRALRCQDIVRQGPGTGVVDYEQFAGRGRALANRLLRRMRHTAAPPDLVEILSINGDALRSSLAGEAGRSQWQEVFGCESALYDPDSSFILMGRPIVHVEAEGGGQRLLWFGNGLEELDRTEFIAHYTTRHGPLVARYAQLIGLRGYRQVPDEGGDTCESLRELGLGRAQPPAVFGELIMGAPPLSLAALRQRRGATREIEADERRHIDFANSMLLLTGRK